MMLGVLGMVAYLVGSIPFGLLAGWCCGKDIRKEGSGNIGATNVLRVCGWKVGLPVFLLDALKGFAPVFWIAPLLSASPYAAPLAGVMAIVGHNFPIWLKFRGGKGVATSAGVMGALLPVAFGIAMIVFTLTVLLSRYVSLGSILAAITLIVAHLLLAATPFDAAIRPLTGMAVLVAFLVVVRHRANIRRLLAGTESKIGAKKATEEGEA